MPAAYVNWWLMALAFVLGLALTLALMIRRVTREVPVSESVGVRGPDVGGKVPDADVRAGRMPSAGATAAGAAAGAAGGAAASKFARGKADSDSATTRMPAGDEATTRMPAGDEGVTGKMPTAGAAAAGAAAAGGVAAAKFAGGKEESATAKIAAVGDEPYGPGSARVAAGASAPSGYTIKGNEDSMLYHTTDSPWYKQTIAEVWFRTEEAADRAGFTRWDKGRAASGGAATFADVPPGPHGPGSAKPSADGSGPAGWTVKGNEDSMLYHSPDSPAYEVTVAEVWFRDEETAVAAGFARWDSGKSQRREK